MIETIASALYAVFVIAISAVIYFKLLNKRLDKMLDRLFERWHKEK